MLRLLIGFSLLIAYPQAGGQPIVNRHYVNTPYSTDILYEYAQASAPERQPLREGAVNCLVSSLKETGLFTDVRVTLNPLGDGQKVDLLIYPTWNPRKESFVIDEITFEGFKGTDDQQLRENLERGGLTSGAPLLQHPFPKIKTAVFDALEDIYQSTPQAERNTKEQISDISVRVTLAAPERVRLIIRAGPVDVCR
jgi:outer membrane protein assembly factor BamA